MNTPLPSGSENEDLTSTTRTTISLALDATSTDNNRAIRLLYDKYAGIMLARLHFLLSGEKYEVFKRSAICAEDILQETWIRIVRNLEKGDFDPDAGGGTTEANFIKWAHAIGNNVLLEELASLIDLGHCVLKDDVKGEDPNDDIDLQSSKSSPLSDQYHRVLNGLSPEDIELLLLYAKYEGLNLGTYADRDYKHFEVDTFEDNLASDQTTLDRKVPQDLLDEFDRKHEIKPATRRKRKQRLLAYLKQESQKT